MQRKIWIYRCNFGYHISFFFFSLWFGRKIAWKKNLATFHFHLRSGARKTVWYATSSGEMISFNRCGRVVFWPLRLSEPKTMWNVCSRICALSFSISSRNSEWRHAMKHTLHGPRFSLIEQKTKKNAKEDLFVRKQSRRENGKEWAQCDQRKNSEKKKRFLKITQNCSIL